MFEGRACSIHLCGNLSALAFIRLREKRDPSKVTEWSQNQMKKYVHNATWNSQHYFFQHYFPQANPTSILSFQYFTSLIYLSPCSLWCEILSFIFLMFRGWKCAEGGTEMSPVVLLEDQLMSRWRQWLCLGLCWCGTMPSCAVTLQVLFNPMKNFVAMSDEYHRFSKLDLVFCP